MNEPMDADAAAEAIADVANLLTKRLTGDYEVDEFGFDSELTETLTVPLLRPLYRKWFRVEVTGLENVPLSGGALLVGNHSGTVAMDALMVQVALFDDHPAHRHLRLLAADFVLKAPLLGEYARKTGATLASNADAERLLDAEELVGVFPEGVKGTGKPVWDRYKLQRFGRGGFVSTALRTGAPIIPVSIVGAEEIYPLIGNIPALARLLKLPYFPVTPTFPWLGPLGLVPLPSKWMIHFGEPIDTKDMEHLADDPLEIFNLADRVKETIADTLAELLDRRGPAFQ
ncbi:MAG TPA: lysophospholipid acyltransferase family protein [Stackebrandtia sp.]|uniref:lysophospholipid acyltransferase family protein n=1 Tax=Stackebrandtia sp. TaxID=2023065 RepID=UPI002D26030A|nr:lysophospholipid acyltransferase family protein [Stackebrandtia sp.]HZE41960.1 lysophospholipid acyltransferase family protein [Stackebrandtia sp.]